MPQTVQEILDEINGAQPALPRLQAGPDMMNRPGAGLALEYQQEIEKKRGPLQVLLDQLMRTTHGSMGALTAAVEGKPVRQIAEAGKAGLSLEERKEGVDLDTAIAKWGGEHPALYSLRMSNPLTALALPPPSTNEPEVYPAMTAAANLLSRRSSTSELKGQLIGTQAGRGIEIGYGAAKGLKKEFGHRARGIGYEIAADPLTYLTLGASALGKGAATALNVTGKEMSSAARAVRAAKLFPKMVGRKMGGVSLAGRSVLPYPVLSEAAHAMKLPKLAEAIRGLPAVEDIGKAFVPFFRYANQDPEQWNQFVKGVRTHLNETEYEQFQFVKELIDKAKELKLTEEEAKLASHLVQYPEIRGGPEAARKAIEQAKQNLVDWKVRADALKGHLANKPETLQPALNKAEREIGKIELDQEVYERYKGKAKAAQEQLTELKKRGTVAGIDEEIERKSMELFNLGPTPNLVRQTAKSLWKEARAMEEAGDTSRQLYKVIREQFGGKIKIRPPRDLKGADMDAWKMLPSAWKTRDMSAPGLDSVIEQAKAAIPGFAEQHGGIVDPVKFVEDLRASHTGKGSQLRIGDFEPEAKKQIMWANTETERNLQKEINELFQKRHRVTGSTAAKAAPEGKALTSEPIVQPEPTVAAPGPLEMFGQKKPTLIERIKAERQAAATSALAKEKKPGAAAKLGELKATKTELEQGLELAGTPDQRVAWKREIEELERKLPLEESIWIKPADEIVQTAETLSKQAPESQKKIGEAARYGRERFEAMYGKERAADLPVQYRERYLPGIYPKAMFKKGGRFERPKTFATLLESKAAGGEPEENLWRLLGQRGTKSIKITHTEQFIDDTLKQFGKRISGDVELGPDESLYARRAALKESMKGDIPDWVMKRIEEAASKESGVVRFDVEEVKEFARLGKDVEVFAMPRGMVDVLNTYGRRIQGESLGAPLRFFDAYTSYFKKWATLPRMGFHVRNTMDNYWRLYLDIGTSAFDPGLNATAAKILHEGSVGTIKLHGQTYTHKEIRELIDKLGGRKHGWVGGDVPARLTQDLDRFFQGKGKKLARAILPTDDFALLRAGRFVGEHIEDHAYAVSFLKNLDKTGDAYEAMQRTKKFLIDYRELTSFERTWGKRLFPFYSFFRKNVPLQAEQMIKQPGKYALIGKGKRAIEGMSEEPEYETPEYYEKAFATRLPVVRREMDPATGQIKEYQQYVLANMSFQELNQLTSVGDFVARMHPLPKAGIELFAEKQAFSGVPGSLSEDEFSSVGEGVELLPRAVRKALDIHQYKTASGEIKWRIPARTKYYIQSGNPLVLEMLQLPVKDEMSKLGWKIDLKRLSSGALLSELDPVEQRKYQYYRAKGAYGKVLKQAWDDARRVPE